MKGDDMIPVTIITRQHVDSDQTLDGIITLMQRDVAFYYCLLSAQVNNRPNIPLVMKTLDIIGGLSKRLAEAYIVKAGDRSQEYFNYHATRKTEEEHWQEIEFVNTLIQFATELDPKIKLKKEHTIEYVYLYQSEEPVQFGGLKLFTRFPNSTVHYFNKTIKDIIIFNRIKEK